MLEKFGDNPFDYNNGLPGLFMFSNALQIWAVLQDSPNVQVIDAATTFNVAPELIAEAATIHPYLVVERRDQDDVRLWTIGHDG